MRNNIGDAMFQWIVIARRYHTLVTLKTSMAIKSVRIDGEQCMKPRGYVSVHCVRVRIVARRRAMDVSDGWHVGAVCGGRWYRAWCQYSNIRLTITTGKMTKVWVMYQFVVVKEAELINGAPPGTRKGKGN